MRRGHVSLERALSKLGLATRTNARALIAAGRVRIDGRVATDPRQEVVPERVHVSIDDVAATPPAPLTIALHKPRSVVTTRRDPEGRPTVYDLVAEVREHLIPVGRLDYATSGLLLMTNDTRLADWLTDPRNEVPRVYLVTVRGRASADDVNALRDGVEAEGETLRARSAQLRKASGRESLIIVELVEGRNREIRRMMTTLGLPVTRLRRVSVGGIALDGLAPGAWRVLPPAELERAFPAYFRK